MLDRAVHYSVDSYSLFNFFNMLSLEFPLWSSSTYIYIYINYQEFKDVPDDSANEETLNQQKRPLLAPRQGTLNCALVNIITGI